MQNARTAKALSDLQEQFPLVDTTRQSMTLQPHREHTQEDVMPRCAEMGNFISEFYMNNQHPTDVVVVTHGTVAIGIVAAMVQRKNETFGDSLKKVHGCVAAGYYHLVPSMSAEDGLLWNTDFTCHSSHLPELFQQQGSVSTPICVVKDAGNLFLTTWRPRVGKRQNTPLSELL